MSGRLVPRLVLAGMLAVAFAAPALAQEGGFVTPSPSGGFFAPPQARKPTPEAPMPRAKNENRVEIVVKAGAMNGIALKWTLEAEPMTSPVPAKPLCCIGECCCNPASALAVMEAKLRRVQRPDLRAFSAYDCTGLGLVSEKRFPPHHGSFIGGSAQWCPVPAPARVQAITGNFGTYRAPTLPQACIPAPPLCVTPAIVPPRDCVISVDGTLYTMPTLVPSSPHCYTAPQPAAAPQAWCPVPPTLPPVARQRPVCEGPTDSTKLMATDAFGDLLIQSGVMPAPCIPVKGCEINPPQMLTITTTVPAKPGIVGTWYRDIGNRRCVVKIAPDHMTITVSDSHEEDGKTVTTHCIITAEYHLTRDGSTAVGLITGVDLRIDGELAEGDMSGFAESITELQKVMEDKPFAMTCRVYGDSLVLGNVRMPMLEGQDDQPAANIGGRYTSAGEKPLPKPKANKAESKVWLGGMTLPSPRYLEHYPQYFAPDPAFPLPRELASPENPQGPVRRAGCAIDPCYRERCQLATQPPSCCAPTLGAVIGAATGRPMPAPMPSPVPTVAIGEPIPQMPTPAEVIPMMELPTPPVPSMTEPTPPSFSANDEAKPGRATKITVPGLGPLGNPLNFSVPLNKAPGDHRQLFNFSTGLFGAQ
jgi:hypothetical protein